MNKILYSLIGALALSVTAASAATITVCANATAARDCRFTGAGSIQAAVDKAVDGDIIMVKAGLYSPAAFRDVPFQDVTLRGYVVIAHKKLTVQGEPGVIIDDARGMPSIAFVVDHADVSFKNLVIRNFRFKLEEDKIYDGHGIFAIDSRVHINDVIFNKIVKMAITGRGNSVIEASNIQLLDGHLGVWLDETAQAKITHAVIRGGSSAAVGAYTKAAAYIDASLIEGNKDDGLFADDAATITVTNSLILDNRPFGINADEKGHISVTQSVLYGNAGNVNPKVATGQLQLGAGVTETDPKLDADWRAKLKSFRVSAQKAAEGGTR